MLVPHGLFLQLCDLRVLSGIGGLSVSGLARGKKGWLFAAGVALGCNVLSRFSNLPEAAMIVGVWAYGIICWLEARKEIGKSLGQDWGDDRNCGKNKSAEKGSGGETP